MAGGRDRPAKQAEEATGAGKRERLARQDVPGETRL
jgi:hypothetical protein